MHGVVVSALSMVLQPQILLTMLFASFMGMVIGAIPGLTAVMGTALLVPVTFYLSPLAAITAIVSMTAMAIFAGDIPGGLVRIPGTPASAAYVDEMYMLTRQGHPERGLGMSMSAAIMGGLLGSLILMFAAPELALAAMQFSNPEYFWLATLGLTIAATVSSGSTAKGLVSVLLGLFISTVGIDPTSGEARYTFGVTHLLAGVSYIPALIGMFALPQILRDIVGNLELPAVPQVKSVLNVLAKQAWKWKAHILRGGLIGTLIGALPGAGADIAAWVAYGVSKRTSKTPEKFGTGHLEGVSEAGAANNGALSGAWVPTLVFGIPGDSITAIVIGVLILKGMTPGPEIFIKQPAMVYAVLISFFIANLILLPIVGYSLVRMSPLVLRVPKRVLLPIVLVASIVGAFAINNTRFDIGIMLVMGVLGWLMESNGFPLAPVVLGIVLGHMIEFNFMITLIKSHGNMAAFFGRPVAAVIGALTIAFWLFQATSGLRKSRKKKRSGGGE